ncbi:MAG: hypothetical protein IJD45_07075 [Clostridia bacterium]|nr:hypothetical protein [Clostridia bacterium]
MSNIRNIVLYYIGQAAYGCVSIMAMGTIFQSFMIECGISEAKVSICVSVIQIVQTLTMLLMSKFAENIKKIFLSVAICLFAQVLPLGAMLFICINDGVSIGIKYVLLFATGLILSFFVGIYSVLSYKQPYHIMKITDYGKVTALAGVISGVLCTLVSAVISFALNGSPYFSTMISVCVFGILLAVVSGAVNFGYVKLDVNQSQKSTKKINIFRYKPFYKLLIPNISRGISMGIFNLTAVIGYHCGILDTATAALLVTISQIAAIISCLTYAYFASRRKNGIICLVSSVVLVMVLPLMTIGQSSLMFKLFYFFGFFFINHITNAVPVIVAENVDYNCIGQYTAWRMALFTGGIAIGGALVPLLLKFVGGTLTLLICGIIMLPCGIGYYSFERQCRKEAGY